MVFQEEVTAEESTDGEIEAQAFNQDSQDSIGEVSSPSLDQSRVSSVQCDGIQRRHFNVI